VVGPTGDGEEMRKRKEWLRLKRGRQMHPDGRSGGRPLVPHGSDVRSRALPLIKWCLVVNRVIVQIHIRVQILVFASCSGIF
jgi:hypothetical protein